MRTVRQQRWTPTIVIAAWAIAIVLMIAALPRMAEVTAPMTVPTPTPAPVPALAAD